MKTLPKLAFWGLPPVALFSFLCEPYSSRGVLGSFVIYNAPLLLLFLSLFPIFKVPFEVRLHLTVGFSLAFSIASAACFLFYLGFILLPLPLGLAIVFGLAASKMLEKAKGCS